MRSGGLQVGGQATDARKGSFPNGGAVAQDEQFYRDLVDSMSDGVYFVDRDRKITYWSGGAERLTGYRATEVTGRYCRDGILNHVDASGAELCGAACPLAATIRDGRRRDAHVYMHHADGHRQPVWVRSSVLYDRNGDIAGAVEVFSDDSAVADARAQLDEQQQLALTDALTAVGNRRRLEMQVEARLDEWRRHALPFGLLMVDIDLFKKVNDTYGHDAGDQVLTMVARTLSFGVRGSDVVTRFGGEEFAVVLGHADPDRLASVGERLRQLVAASRLMIGLQPIEVTVSIGGALVEPGDDQGTLLRRADAALYEAKRNGRNRLQVDARTMQSSKSETDATTATTGTGTTTATTGATGTQPAPDGELTA
jgi:diguanylate cyclase (GGDEF)-like protein/PAS domain S-box-containing protein